MCEEVTLVGLARGGGDVAARIRDPAFAFGDADEPSNILPALHGARCGDLSDDALFNAAGYRAHLRKAHDVGIRDGVEVRRALDEAHPLLDVGHRDAAPRRRVLVVLAHDAEPPVERILGDAALGRESIADLGVEHGGAGIARERCLVARGQQHDVVAVERDRLAAVVERLVHRQGGRLRYARNAQKPSPGVPTSWGRGVRTALGWARDLAACRRGRAACRVAFRGGTKHTRHRGGPDCRVLEGVPKAPFRESSRLALARSPNRR